MSRVKTLIQVIEAAARAGEPTDPHAHELSRLLVDKLSAALNHELLLDLDTIHADADSVLCAGTVGNQNLSPLTWRVSQNLSPLG